MYKIVSTVLLWILSQLFITGTLVLIYGIIFGFTVTVILILTGISVLLAVTLIALKVLCNNAPGALSDSRSKENENTGR